MSDNEKSKGGKPYSPKPKKKGWDGVKRPPRPPEDKHKGPKADLYGFHAVEAAWLNPAREIKTLYITENAAENFEPVLQRAKEAGLNRPKIQISPRSKIDQLCPKDAVHQGIALFCKPLPEIAVQDLIIRAHDKPRSLVLVLDQITDPHNIGAILRSAVAFGASGVVLQRKHSPELNGALAKVASGAAEHIDVAYETNISRALETLKDAGYFAYGLDERGETEIQNAALADKAVLVLGAEGPGIRPKVKETCDQLLRIPMTSALASINVSNAAAISLFAWVSGK